MKKLLGLLLVMTMAWPVAASADVLKNVDLKGEVQVIGSDVRANESDAYNSGTNLRVMAGASFNLVEDVRANLMFQYANAWGNAPLADQGFGTNGRTAQNYLDDVKLAEANVVLSNLFDCFELTIGRQFYGDENSAVMYFGPNHYNAERYGLANSLDAVKFTYSDDAKAFTVLAGRVVTNTNPADVTPAPAVLTDDAAIYGADFKLNLTEALKWQVYGYDLRNVAYTTIDADGNVVNAADENAGFYGTKLAFAPEAFTVSAEYARNFAGDRLVKEHKDTGYMVKADAALNLEAFTPRFAFVYSANEFNAFGNYMPGLLVGNRVDVFKVYKGNGLRLFNVGVDYNYGKWTFALDGYSFQDRYATYSATLEADLTAKYAHNEYVELFAGVGYAKYGTEEKDPTKGNMGRDNTKGQIGMLLKF